MRTLIIISFLFLAACNGSGNDDSLSAQNSALDEKISALESKLDDQAQQIKAAQDALKAQDEKFNSIQIMGPSLGESANTNSLMYRALAVDFGPCDSIGIKIGSVVKPGATSALGEQLQAFKQAPTATCPGVYAEYEVETGNLGKSPRVFFDGPGCTGNAYVWGSAGFGYDRQKMNVGIAFTEPFSGSQYWVAPGTHPVMVQAQTAYIVLDSACEPDLDLQPMWLAVPTTTQISGVPMTLGSDYQIEGL